MSPLIQQFYTKKKLAKTFLNIFGENAPPSSEEIDGFWLLMNFNNGKLIFNKLIRYLIERKTHQTRWLKALQETNVPLRLIDGLVDSISGQHLVNHYKKVIPNTDVISLENIGHYPQTEVPKLALQHYRQFRIDITSS